MRQMRWLGVVGDADALGPGVFGVGLGAAAQNKGNEMCSHKNWKNEKRKPFKLCWSKKDTN